MPLTKTPWGVSDGFGGGRGWVGYPDEAVGAGMAAEEREDE